MWQTIGHSWVTDLLQHAIATQRVGHAYLITGPAHIGKATLAREFAAALVCSGAERPCGQCRACRQVAADAHPDVLAVAAQDGTLKIDQVRDLQRDLALSPHSARYRIALLLDMHLATEEAGNALLKTLEEPASRAVLVLTATDASMLLPTVISRCQTLALRGVPAPTIALALQARNVAAPQAELLARLAAGRVGWALRAAADSELLCQRTSDIDVLLRALQGGRLERLRAAEALSDRERGALPELANLGQTLWRDVLFVAKDCEDLVVNLDRLDVLRHLAGQCTAEQAAAACNSVDRLLELLQQNVTAKQAFEDMLLSWPVMAA
ncbi:MAG: DNA polymerase III subunit [Chloroflexi bacterium]|nr:DNA polymerase III subunit [Chloroflexota bacterium]